LKSHKWGTTLLGVVFLAAGSAQASIITINFDDLAQNELVSNGVSGPSVSPVLIVSNQYAVTDGVTFSASSTDPGSFAVLVESHTGYNTSTPPNIITVGTTTGLLMYNSAVSLTLTFANAASNLNFDAFANDSTAPGNAFALADIYQNGSLTPTTISLLATTGSANNGTQADPQNLSAFPNITKLVIRDDTDIAGTAFDNFTFSATASPVPEPSTFLLLGLGGMFWAGRRFVARKNS